MTSPQDANSTLSSRDPSPLFPPSLSHVPLEGRETRVFQA